MSQQPQQPPARSGKVTVLNSGELQYASSSSAASATSGGATAATAAAAGPPPHQTVGGSDNKAPRRKVGTTFERSFAAEPTPPQPGGRPVLKAGRPVSSAPPALLQRPLTELERAFAERPMQDQRWLLTFPLALKQLYFGFAESPNHEQILGNLIRRFPELLAGNERHPSAIQVAIERGNWTPAMHFVKACGGQHTQLLLNECGLERQTFLMLAIKRVGQPHPPPPDPAAAASDEQLMTPADDEPARKLICALATACPELMTSADSCGRNAMHYCAAYCAGGGEGRLLQSLLLDLRAACQATPELARRLGDALVAGDANGRRPVDLAASASAQEALQRLELDFPQQPGGVDEVEMLEPGKARDELCAALEERGKSAQFVEQLSLKLASRDYRLGLLRRMENPVQSALDWLIEKESNRPELKQVLTDMGQPDLCQFIDRL